MPQALRTSNVNRFSDEERYFLFVLKSSRHIPDLRRDAHRAKGAKRLTSGYWPEVAGFGLVALLAGKHLAL